MKLHQKNPHYSLCSITNIWSLIIQCQSMFNYLYDKDPLLVSCSISIEKQLTKFDGRVLNFEQVEHAFISSLSLYIVTDITKGINS